MIRQHHAARAEPDAIGDSPDVRDQDLGRRRRDARHVVVLGVPDAGVPEALERAREVDGVAQRGAGRAAARSGTRSRAEREGGMGAAADGGDGSSPHRGVSPLPSPPWRPHGRLSPSLFRPLPRPRGNGGIVFRRLVPRPSASRSPGCSCSRRCRRIGGSGAAILVAITASVPAARTPGHDHRAAQARRRARPAGPAAGALCGDGAGAAAGGAFPANVHAARAGLTLGGKPVTPIGLRAVLRDRLSHGKLAVALRGARML